MSYCQEVCYKHFLIVKRPLFNVFNLNPSMRGDLFN